MTDKNSGNKPDRKDSPKDLPTRPNDKKTDDKVKGGRAPLSDKMAY